MVHKGEVYVFGGQNAHGKGITTVEVFDVNERGCANTNHFRMPALPHERHDFAVVNKGAEVFVIAGADSTAKRCQDVDVFNLDTKERYSLAPLKEGRSRTAAVIFQGKLLVIGGLGLTGGSPPRQMPTSSVECYDFNTKKWSFFPPMTRARDGHCACVYDGKVYVFGGRLQDFNDVQANTTTIEYYDPADNKWHFKQNLTIARWCSGVIEI
jgi:N-acetylneuraminic acid mutarotase